MREMVWRPKVIFCLCYRENFGWLVYSYPFYNFDALYIHLMLTLYVVRVSWEESCPKASKKPVFEGLSGQNWSQSSAGHVAAGWVAVLQSSLARPSAAWAEPFAFMAPNSKLLPQHWKVLCKLLFFWVLTCVFSIDCSFCFVFGFIFKHCRICWFSYELCCWCSDSWVLPWWWHYFRAFVLCLQWQGLTFKAWLHPVAWGGTRVNSCLQAAALMPNLLRKPASRMWELPFFLLIRW